MMPHLQEVSGAVTKNLFLKDKKKKGLWLVSARHDRQVNLNELAKKLGVGSGNLRFADEAAMLEKLKVGRSSGRSGLCDGSRSALRRGPECEVCPGPGPGGGGPRDGLLPPDDQRCHRGAPPPRPAALPEGDGTRTHPGELRVGPGPGPGPA
ncbi:putative prolyl-tRNA synthetase associated domain-containing protein 1 isoform X3 [Brachyistius frenatus]